MKFFVATLALSLFATPALATPVDGEIFYILSTGDLATRNVTIDVPSRGQGKVVLRGGSDFESESSDFRTFVNKGRTLFQVVFLTEFGKKKSTLVFRGTYLKGDNQLKYYGDLYKAKGHTTVDDALTNTHFVGGFAFNYDRSNPGDTTTH